MNDLAAESRLEVRGLTAASSNDGDADARRAKRIASAAIDPEPAEFIALLTQELRQSLQAMLGFAQLMERDGKEPLSERQRQRVRCVLDAGNHLARVVDETFALSRIEAGQVGMVTQAVDVLDVLEHVRTALEPHAMSRRLELTLDHSAGLSERPSVAADAGSFAQVLLKLGTNAIENSKPQSTVTFHVSRVGPSKLRTSVIDTGSGVPLEEQHKLFQPFPHVNHAGSSAAGTGLGLVLCKRMIELMRGAIGYRSVPGQGSEFWVDLPVHTG